MTRQRVLPLVVAGLLGLAMPAAAGPPDPFGALGLVRFESGIKAPGFVLPGPNGDRTSLSTPTGSATLLMFWATW